jgi:hypothetical protein
MIGVLWNICAFGNSTEFVEIPPNTSSLNDKKQFILLYLQICSLGSREFKK